MTLPPWINYPQQSKLLQKREVKGNSRCPLAVLLAAVATIGGTSSSRSASASESSTTVYKWLSQNEIQIDLHHHQSLPHYTTPA